MAVIGGGGSVIGGPARSGIVIVPLPQPAPSQIITVSTIANVVFSVIVGIAALIFAGQPIIVNKRKNVVVTVATLAYAAQLVLTNARRNIVVGVASITISGRAIVLALTFHAFLLAASMQIIGRTLLVTIAGTATKVVNRIWLGFGLGL